MEEEEERKKIVVIDVSNVQSKRELHKILKEKLGFPNFYGMNWGAFWDAITGLVELPETIIFQGFNTLKLKLPETAEILMRYFKDYCEWEPLDETEIIYK